MIGKCGIDSSSLGQISNRPCVHGNRHSGFIEYGEIFTDYQLPERHLAPWS
jgi:hypothetical protein